VIFKRCFQFSVTVLRTPWRETSWGGENKQELLQYVKNFQPQNEEIQAIRVLLHGPVGAGKSSFINSVNNVLQGKMTNEALASSTTSDQSFTKKYQTYKIKKESKDNFYPFVFNDIMGLEEKTGVRTDDIKLALEGHVKDGYKFNPISSLSDDEPGYNSSPSISDRVHVLVCIYDANAPQMKSSVLQKMKEVREAASELAPIPSAAALTRLVETLRRSGANSQQVVPGGTGALICVATRGYSRYRDCHRDILYQTSYIRMFDIKTDILYICQWDRLKLPVVNRALSRMMKLKLEDFSAAETFLSLGSRRVCPAIARTIIKI
uniref:G domain-containing protein n=1 Tax=Xiphophorus couchianus TaxID=32473 RepID=A0A3B5LKS2_9TELE